MAEPQILPQNLVSLREAIIDVVFGRSKEEPKDIKALFDWLESDGWEVLIESSPTDVYALDIKALANWCFNDEELASWWGYDLSEIDDPLRLKFARERMATVFDDDEFLVKSVCAAYFENNNQEGVYVGAYLDVQGPNGMTPHWLGIFVSYEEFLQNIRISGTLVLFNDCPMLTDEYLLELWQ